MVLDKADEELEEGRFLSAVLIDLCVIEEMLDLQQSCDDSDGTIGWLVESALDTIFEAAKQVSVGEHEARPTLFAKILEASALTELDEWSEWRQPLLEVSSTLMQTAEERSAWERQITVLEEQERRESANRTYRSYWGETLAELRYGVIRQWDGEEAAAAFMQSHLHMRSFREKMIEQAFSAQRWEEAERLIEGGELADAQVTYPGQGQDWRKFRYRLYRLANRIDEQRRLAEEFALSGEHDLYLELRGLYTEEEWPAVNERILTVLEEPTTRRGNAESMYLRLLTEQRDTKRLLAYVRRNTWYLEELSPYLLTEYTEDVHQLFAKRIEEEAERANNRSQYKKVCDSIRQLVRADGSEKALELLAKLRMTHSNRPAFVDELEQVKVPG